MSEQRPSGQLYQPHVIEVARGIFEYPDYPGELTLVKRPATSRNEAGKYELPGGKAKRLELPDGTMIRECLSQTLQRETEDESGFIVEPENDDILWTPVLQRLIPDTVDEAPYAGSLYTVYVMPVRVVGGSIENRKHTEEPIHVYPDEALGLDLAEASRRAITWMVGYTLPTI